MYENPGILLNQCKISGPYKVKGCVDRIDPFQIPGGTRTVFIQSDSEDLGKKTAQEAA